MSKRLKRKKLAEQSRAAEKALSYTVYVDDNFSHIDEDSRFSAGEFATYEEALKEAVEITRRNLEQSFKPVITRKELMNHYKHFGLDRLSLRALRTSLSFRHGTTLSI